MQTIEEWLEERLGPKHMCNQKFAKDLYNKAIDDFLEWMQDNHCKITLDDYPVSLYCLRFSWETGMPVVPPKTKKKKDEIE